MNEIILTERANIVAIANAVRNKTGKNNNMNLGQIVDAINSIAQAVGIDLDAEMNAQDAKIASQDALIANIVSALEGKAIGGGNIEIPSYQMVSTIINYNITNTIMEVSLSYLGLNEDGILAPKEEVISGSGSITIVSSVGSLIEGFCMYGSGGFKDPTVTITFHSTGYDAYQEALVHYGILSGAQDWFFMLPGGTFNLTVN